MGEVVDLKACANIPAMLRAIADDIENGNMDADNVTLIAVPYVYQLGGHDDVAATRETVFNCNYAIHKLMQSIE